MTDSMAQTRRAIEKRKPETWKIAVSWAAAVAVGPLFLASGLWKLSDLQGAAVRMAQALVPASLSFAAALGFGIVETIAALWILVPRLRRWGAAATGLLLVAFLIYVGVHYHALLGEDCSCFPWIKRAVGPAFFAGDAAMLLAAMLAGAWAPRSASLRAAVLMAAPVLVLAAAAWGVEAARETGIQAPASIVVDGKPFSLETGRVLLFFFNPACTHCAESARRMAQYRWNGVEVVVAPVELPQFARQFLADTGLHAGVSPEFERLAGIFHYTAYPFAVAVEHGREKAAFTVFGEREPESTLRRMGWVQ